MKAHGAGEQADPGSTRGSSEMNGSSIKKTLVTAVILGYAAVVLGVDWFVQGPQIYGADTYKFVAWFLIPFLVCLPTMDWGYFGVRRWRRMDYGILVTAIVLEMVAVLAVRWFPALKAGMPRVDYTSVWRFTVWNMSWVIGWEFLHRYVLLRHLSARWPRFGWLLVPVYETAYHLNWPTLLMPAGMMVFSLIATWWSLKRRNGLLPFLAHLIIELQLTVFLLFTD
jgi:hypothetical protein